VADAKKIDPFDVEALEKSLNDSATRVSTIWVSYLLFGLYLVIAAGNVTHRQIFLADPVKLPVLGVELPLVGFFFLAPIIFVTYHVYVMIQVVLLARTAEAYNEAVERNVANEAYRDRVRQRLANTLFAQIFAGSARERSGILGILLSLMAWVTLVIAPICVLLVVEFKFLPYHSSVATWTHRFLVIVDLLSVLLLWPLVLEGKKGDIRFRTLRDWRTSAFVPPVFFLAFGLLNFPGEIHANWLRSDELFLQNGVVVPHQCQRFIGLFRNILPPTFDRLVLRGETAIDVERLAKIEIPVRDKYIPRYQTERLRSFRNRDFSCGIFESADLRNTDFFGAVLVGANLNRADLTGAVLDGSDLADSYLNYAQLEGTAFRFAKLGGASLRSAHLQGANLLGAELGKNVSLSYAELDGANLAFSDFRGANLTGASLQWANLSHSLLHGANLSGANLQGANLSYAELQASALTGASLAGANLSFSQLQGTIFDQNTKLELSYIRNAFLWSADSANCRVAQVIEPHFNQLLQVTSVSDPIKGIGATADELEKFLDKIGYDEKLSDQLRGRLSDENLVAKGQKGWSDCSTEVTSEKTYVENISTYFMNLACRSGAMSAYVAAGILRRAAEIDDDFEVPAEFNDNDIVIQNMLDDLNSKYPSYEIARSFARRVLEETGCPALNNLNDRARNRLLYLKKSNSP